MASYTYHTLAGAQGKPVSMDPWLMRAMAYKQSGQRKPATSSTAENEIAVIARVTDAKAWRGLSEVLAGAEIPSPAMASGGRDEWIVTGRVPISRLEYIRARPFVASLKAARRLHPGLAAGTQEILATPALLPVGNHCAGGQGAIVGIVDIGCDFAHRNFIDSHQHTRLKFLWVQGAPSTNSGVPFGRLISPAEMNAAIPKPNPYQALGYRPGAGVHGTHVMDIAAGNGLGTGVKGVAPLADLMFVHIASSDIPWEGPEAVGKSFGDSVQLLEALQFVFAQAGTQPCSINVSLGTNGGPHDGTTLVEQGIDSLIRAQPNRMVSIAASNSFADGIHAAATVPAQGSSDLLWSIGPQDATDNELEVWYPGNARLDVELIDPNGTSLGRVPPGQSGSVTDQGQIVVFIANRLDDPNNHDNNIGVFLSPAASAGTWSVRLHNTTGTSTPLHAWIERDDNGQSSFLPAGNAELDNSHSLGSISCGRETVVVGSYDAHQPGAAISFFSSAGPTRDGRPKPEVSAPGHQVRAASAESKTGVTTMSGTSMATPMVTGVIALMLAEAAVRGRSLTNAEIRQIVTSSARQAPPQVAAGTWDSRYGFGRVSAQAAVQAVMNLSALPVANVRGARAPVASIATARKARAVARAKPTPTRPSASGGKSGGARRAAGGRRR